MNENWQKWVISSINKNFVDLDDFEVWHPNATKTPIVVEGQNFDSGNFKSISYLRFNGPIFNQRSRSNWVVEIDVNLLISMILDESDIYALDSLVGKAQLGFVNQLPLYKYGNGNSFWFCLERVSTIKVTPFGQIDAHKHVYQSTIEAKYLGDFDV